MPFPDKPRVRYRKNTLRQVVCQVRFPTILRIGTEAPADFQERIRERFPLYSEVKQALTEIELPEPLARIVRDQMNLSTGPVTHQFRSADEKRVVGLSTGFLSLTDRAYTRWEEFWEHLEAPLSALEDIYRPAFYERIGLRYQNVIRRSALGLGDRGWGELLEPHIAGELARPEIAAEVEQAARQLIVNLGADQGKVQVQHGLLLDAEGGGTPEACFGIDADFYRGERSEVRDGREVLERFNKRARSLFRWCITDVLHEAMEPEPL